MNGISPVINGAAMYTLTNAEQQSESSSAGCGDRGDDEVATMSVEDNLSQAALCISTAYSLTHNLHSSSFDVSVDIETGALLSITNPHDVVQMNWISSPQNAPWQPASSRWGLGYADLGAIALNRYFWNSPTVSINGDVIEATYQVGSLTLQVTRKLDNNTNSFEERYKFTNKGKAALNLSAAGIASLAIYTPFNDHYTNTSDVLEHRSHAHIWASGQNSSWVKTTRMGGRGRHLGLVVTAGALLGYSVEARDIVTSSNTRGVFLVHPDVPVLHPGDSSILSWTMFWHDDWNDFFSQCVSRSNQFIRFEASSLTAFPGETLDLVITGAVGESATLNGTILKLQDSKYHTSIPAGALGEQSLQLSTNTGVNTSIIINTVPYYLDTISKRVDFIVSNQQISPFADSNTAGAYVLYDNQMNGIVTFEPSVDRNPARERVGMGVLVGRWLLHHFDTTIRASFDAYYEYVWTRLQNSDGYVYDSPLPYGDGRKRLYNFPWVMQLHLAMEALERKTNTSIGGKSSLTPSPMHRFLVTVENFYTNGGAQSYSIGIPVYHGLQALKAYGDTKSYERILGLFVGHGEQLIKTGIQYPASEVNFEQSIVAPAATFLLELYRATGDQSWLQAARPHFELLHLFGGQQPDYHLHDIAIRHWDGYWFGKDRIWGDTFPHYWSTLTAVAMHHYAKATGDSAYAVRADNILRSNLALFTPDGRGSCAWLYPLTVNGLPGHYKDPYANDQDWALVHTLQVLED